MQTYIYACTLCMPVCVCVCIIEYQFSVCARTKAAAMATTATEGSQSFINVGGARPDEVAFC